MNIVCFSINWPISFQAVCLDIGEVHSFKSHQCFYPSTRSFGLLTAQCLDSETEHYYIKPVHIVHPFFYPALTNLGCRKHGTEPNIQWTQWTGKGPRDVHGLMEAEFSIGYQMQCKMCAAGGETDAPDCDSTIKPRLHFWAATNRSYWAGLLHWQVPCACSLTCAFVCLLTFSVLRYPALSQEVCLVSRELFDIIIEMRPSLPSATLQDHIKPKFSHT